MTIKTDLGYIEITSEVMAGIAGYAASSCFGVKGMTIRSMSDGLAHLLGRENQSRGVKVTEAPDGGVNIDLHIAVEHGVNIATVCRSIISEVRYHVERLTGVDVKNVDIYVESIKADRKYSIETHGFDRVCVLPGVCPDRTRAEKVPQGETFPALV